MYSQLMEGDGSPGWVVMAQNRCARARKVEKLIKFDEKDGVVGWELVGR